MLESFQKSFCKSSKTEYPDSELTNVNKDMFYETLQGIIAKGYEVKKSRL